MPSPAQARDSLLSVFVGRNTRAGLGIALCGGCLIVGLWLLYFAGSTLVLPYPIEYREGASQVMTAFLLQAQNPFSLDNHPIGMNNYGILFNAVALPLAALFGNTLLVHRAVAFAFIIFSGVLAFRTALVFNGSPSFALACGLLVAVGLVGRGGIGAFPSAMGSFLYLGSLLVPLSRSFDNRGMLYSIVLALAAFFTKPYFVLAMAIVFSYEFLFLSKKRALAHGALFLGLLLISSLVVRYYFKLYFIDTLVSNLANIDRDPQHLLNQLELTMAQYYPVAILGIALPILRVLPLAANAHTRTELQPGASTSDGRLRRPEGHYLGYASICAAAVFVFLLGAHEGATMTYVYQLVAPPCLLWLFQELRQQSRFVVIAVPLVLVNMASLSHALLNPAFLRQMDAPAWARLYSLIDPTDRILNSPVVTSRMVELGMQPTDSGQTEYFYLINPYPECPLLGPSYTALRDRGKHYDAELRRAIQNRQFDMIILTQGRSYTPRSVVAVNYYMSETLTVEMPQADQAWSLSVWKRIGED